MTVCDSCGNHDGNLFTIMRGAETGTFDSFECAIHVMAPQCGHCGCPILGHGIKNDAGLYCCEHCGTQASTKQSTPTEDADRLAVSDKQVARWKDDGGAVST